MKCSTLVTKELTTPEANHTSEIQIISSYAVRGLLLIMLYIACDYAKFALPLISTLGLIKLTSIMMNLSLYGAFIPIKFMSVILPTITVVYWRHGSKWSHENKSIGNIFVAFIVVNILEAVVMLNFSSGNILSGINGIILSIFIIWK
eukprot:UN25654